jgi:hypothetical protein
MILLRVDGVELPLRGVDVDLPLYDASKLRSVSAWRSGEQVVVDVVSTPESDRVFGYAFDLHCGEPFNDSLHSALLEVDGVVLLEGKATLLSTIKREGVCYYRISLRSGGSDWAELVAKTQLRETNIECSMQMIPYDIERSWSAEQAVRLLPLQHDSYPSPQDSGLWGQQRILTPTDYHPFISVRELLLATARSAGYRLESRWADSSLVRKLMISGAYGRVNTEAAERAMGFKAYRTRTISAVANSGGYVFAWEPVSGANVGVIVDSVDANAVDDQGDSHPDAYSNGGAMHFEEGRPIFTPTRDISVAYEYTIRYRTEYRIASSRYLKGFDHIYLGPGCNVELKLANPFENQVNKLRPDMAYKLFIFDYNSNYDYMLRGIGSVSGRVSELITPMSTPAQAQLYFKPKGEGTYSLYTGDWAIYEGFVEECGERDIELVVRTPYNELSASSDERFSSISFYGAEAGQQLTLYAGCSVQAIFGGSVGYGESIEFKDVANHPISQQQLLEALMHMFNLCVYSHQPSKRLVIEPYDDFYSGSIVDWRDRQIDGEWSIVEGAPESFENVRLCYAGHDGVVARENGVSDKEFGVWSGHFESFGTKQGVDSRVNPLFLPTLSVAGSIGPVPSAEILTVGDRDSVTKSDYVEPRVVLYHGMKILPAGQKWVAYTSANIYPHVAFHSKEAGATLCFEDRDGCKGLHSYYDNELKECAERGSLRCTLYLPAADYLALLDPNNSDLSIRSRFRLEVAGASSLYTLLSVEHYNPDSGVATCLFRRTTTD